MDVPSPDDPHVRHVRMLFLTVITASFVFLIPWLGYLVVTLPANHVVHHWKLAWVGFDLMLIVSIGLTALMAWRRRQLFIPAAVVTGTLLICDAWFDTVLEWGASDQWIALATALLGELPLAVLLFYAARRLIVLTLRVALATGSPEQPIPRLSRVSLLLLAEVADSSFPGVSRTT